jgi:hypothetical protein
MHYRNAMGSSLDATTQGGRQAIGEIGALKAKMMSYIENYTQQFAPELQVRAPLRAWAINEGYRGALEDMGASVGKPRVGVVSKIIPESINDNIMRNSSTVQTVKNFLGNPDEFNKITANYLAEQQAKAITDGAFSAHRFGSFIKGNQDAINSALGGNPALQRIKDLITIMRVLPEAKSINPAGTAKTLMGMIQGGSLYPPDLAKEIGSHVMEFLRERAATKLFNAQMAAKAQSSAASNVLKTGAAKTTRKLDIGVKALFSGAASVARKIP